jgi:hypothetical protein
VAIDHDDTFLTGKNEMLVSANCPLVAFTEKINPCKVIPYNISTINTLINIYINEDLLSRVTINRKPIEITINFVGDIDNDNYNEVFFNVIFGNKDYQKDYYYCMATLQEDKLIPFFEDIEKDVSLSGDNFEAFFDIVDIDGDGIFEIINYAGPYWQIGYKFYSINNKKLKELLQVTTMITS